MGLCGQYFHCDGQQECQRRDLRMHNQRWRVGDAAENLNICTLLPDDLHTVHLYLKLQVSKRFLSSISPAPAPRARCNRSSCIGGSRDVAPTAGPVYVDILAFWVLLRRELWLDAECVGAEVVPLCL